MVNVLSIDYFNEEEFLKRFTVYKIKRNEKTKVKLKEEPVIYAAYYPKTEKEYAYVLTESSATPFKVERSISNTSVVAKVLPDRYIVLGLLISSLSNTNLTHNNLKQNLYQIASCNKSRSVIVTTKHSLNENFCLSADVVSFATYDKSKDEGKQKYFYCDDEYYMNELDPDSSRKVYTRHSFEKNRVSFYNTDKDEQHKVSQLFKVKNDINKYYKDFIKVSFAKENNFQRIWKGSYIDGKVYFDKVFGDDAVNIVFEAEYNDSYIEMLKDLNFKYQISDSIKKDMPNLVFIKDEKYYKENSIEDQHKSSKEYVVQHITVDKPLTSSILKQCLLELRVKKDVVNKHITLCSLDGFWQFYKISKDKNDKGRYEIKQMNVLNNNIVDIDKGEEITDDLVFMLKELKREGFVVVHNNKSLAIISTNLRPLPEYDFFKSEHSINHKKSYKSKEDIGKFYSSLVDVNTFMFNGSKYYSVGSRSASINADMGNSPSVKEVVENGLSIEELSDMFKENATKINQYSVYPYPFKVMSEVLKDE